MNKVELLAPAGSFEALEAAINAGADAIYLGGTNFGARHYASNFDSEELIKAVDLAHLHRVKIYVTVNVLNDNSELAELADYLEYLQMIGVDAIIVQDIAVAEIARTVAPNLELHASTQMSIMNSQGVDFAERMGFSRVVLARECSLDEIAEIHAQSNLELETFVHGALCVCYSGQCLMSSMIGGRSGNRGKCAQPCRLQYKLVDEQDNDLLEGKAGQYLLSPRDMNTVDIIPQLIEAGVMSFKIEGRMKRPEYVAVVVEAYRRAIDAYYAGKKVITADDRRNLAQVFNRDFTQAYLVERPGKNMISDKRPNNRGVQIGRVSSYDHGSRMVGIKLEEDIMVGDGVEFWVSVGGRVAMTIEYIELNGQEVESAKAGDEVFFIIPAAVRLSDRVFRTFDAKLMKHAAEFFGENKMRKIPVKAVVKAYIDQPMEIVFTDDEGNIGRAQTGFIGQVAQKRPLTEETVFNQLSRLGTTQFCLDSWELQADSNVMFPISEINEARRQAIEDLYSARTAAYKHTDEAKQGSKYTLARVRNKRSADTKLSVQVDDLTKARLALEAAADVIIIGGENFNHMEFSIEDCRKIIEQARAKGTMVVVATPRIIKEFNLAYALDRVYKVAALKPDAIMLGTASMYPAVAKTGIPVWLDFGINTFNSADVAYWEGLGVQTAMLSPELTMEQIQAIANRAAGVKLECLVQGRVEMMVSEYCVAGSFLGDIHEKDCYGACAQKLYLQDRMQEKFPVVTDQFCRMHILNAKELSMLGFTQKFVQLGIDYLRIDARYMSGPEMVGHIKDYKMALAGIEKQLGTNNNYTKGHYFRGVL